MGTVPGLRLSGWASVGVVEISGFWPPEFEVFTAGESFLVPEPSIFTGASFSSFSDSPVAVLERDITLRASEDKFECRLDCSEARLVVFRKL